jgi:hypothetical protein
VRRRDISGLTLPKTATPLGNPQNSAPAVIVARGPEIEPPPGAQEFILSWSIIAPNGVTSQLFTLDATPAQNVTNGAAFQLPDNTRARISGVIIEGESIAGTPVLQFSIRTTKDGQTRLPGWAGVNLPGRGGIVNMGIEPFTLIPTASFFGAFVTNSDGAPHYAAITIQGWMY